MEPIRQIITLYTEEHPKAWGSEKWIVNNEKYCAKILTFKAGKSFSNHYHWVKEETWLVTDGELLMTYFDLSNADELKVTLKKGDIIHIPPGNPHKLEAITDAVIWEVSTPHYEKDSYRIGKGSSQS